MMYPTFLLFAIGLVLISQAHQGSILLLGAAFVGLGFGTFMPCAQAIAVKAVPIHHLGLATSTFFIFMDGGMGFGPSLLGVTIPVLGYRGLYLSMGILAIASMVLYYFLCGRPSKQGKLVIYGN